MNFTYDGYKNLILQLKDCGYHITDYHSWENSDKCVILRHDIDNDVYKATLMAEFESSLNVKSTYFVLITSDFYNVHSARTESNLKRIMDCGHEIGLHFDETRYPGLNVHEIEKKIIDECNILSNVIGGGSYYSFYAPSK